MVAAFASTAGAKPVPPDQFTCGVTVFTPCNQTAHFSSINEQLTPSTAAAGSNCPSFVKTDFASLTATGNGVEHSIVNKAGDGWFTSTFTGTATITPYLDASLTVPDPNAGAFTGRLTEWFGGSFNRSNFVVHSTFHFTGTNAEGMTLRVLDIAHTSTNASNPFGPPHSFEIFRCG
jgi:hypothetical protein